MSLSLQFGFESGSSEVDKNPLNKAMISFNYDFQTWKLRYTLVDKKTSE